MAVIEMKFQEFHISINLQKYGGNDSSLTLEVVMALNTLTINVDSSVQPNLTTSFHEDARGFEVPVL